MAEVHLVTVGLKRVGSGGQVVPVGSTIMENLQFTTEHRVLPNANVPNSEGYPSVETFLIAEAANGFLPNHVSQYLIITVKP